MLRAFHKYQKSVLLIFLAVIICAAMLLFGLNPYGNSTREAYALKINGEEISQNDFYNARRNLENNYRQRFGEMYEQLIKLAGIDVTQQTVDQLISRALLTQFAKNQDLVVSPEAVKSAILGFFGNNFSRETYQAYLQNTGQTAESFEASLAGNLLPEELMKIIKTHTNASRFEIENSLIKADTKYSYSSIIFDPEKYLTEIKDATADVLAVYYEENAAEYEIPEKVKYSYVALDPEQYLNLVEILPEDIELYYSDHLNDYSNPEEAKVSQSVIAFDATNTEEQINAKNQADSVLKKVKEGKSFETAIKELNFKLEDAKWMKKGEGSKSFDEAAFNLEAMGSVKLISEPGRYLLIQVQDFKESKVTPLEEVKDEIKKNLQRKDAPAYVLIKAQDLFDEWQNNNKSLRELAAKHNLKLVQNKEPLSATEDPHPTMKQLSKMVLENAAETKQFQEVGDFSVLVEVSEIIERKIPQIDAVKDKLIEKWKREQSMEYTKKKAEEFLEKAMLKDADIAKLLTEYKAESKEKFDILPNARDEELLSEEIRTAIFDAKEPGFLASVYPYNEKIYALDIKSIVKPHRKEIESKVADEEKKQTEKNYQDFLESFISKLKANAEIEIAPSFL